MDPNFSFSDSKVPSPIIRKPSVISFKEPIQKVEHYEKESDFQTPENLELAHGNDHCIENEKTDIHVFASNVTLHGIYHVFARHNVPFKRLCWSIVFIVAFTSFLYNVLNRVFLYSRYPHTTKIEEESTWKNTLDFPQVTFCNMNSYKWKTFTPEDLIYSNEVTGLIEWDKRQQKYKLTAPKNFGQNDVHNLLYNTHNKVVERLNFLLSVADMFGLKFEREDFDLMEFTNRTGHQLEDILQDCSYRGEKCDMKYFKTTMTRYGKCYTFNHGEGDATVLETLKGGKDNGLELLLNVESDEYLPVWKTTDENTPDMGFKVQIHAQNEPPLINELGFGISPGFQTLVTCKEQRIRYLPKPYGDCIPVDSTFTQGFETYVNKYSVSACRQTCETKEVAEKCNCRMVHQPAYNNTKVCNPVDYLRCADPTLDWLVEKDQDTCLCENPCELIKYSLGTSMLALPSFYGSTFYAEKYNVTDSYVYDNFLKLNIFFEALNYESISQIPAYDFASLLGDIGGNMGLFIGASILTVIEVFDFIYENIKFRLQKIREFLFGPSQLDKQQSTEQTEKLYND